MNKNAKREMFETKICCDSCGEFILDLNALKNKQYIQYECSNCGKKHDKKINEGYGIDEIGIYKYYMLFEEKGES